MCKIVWNNCPWKRKQNALCEMQKKQEAQKSWCDLDFERNQLVGTEFGGQSRWSHCVGKNSTIDLPLFDHVTLFQA